MSERRIRRGARGAAYEKLALSMPRETAQRLRSEVEARGGPSVSAYVTAAVEEKLEREDLRAILDDIFREEPLTADERAWADRALGLE